MKADLHVHSYHSGYNHDLPFLRSRDCYTPPEVVYRTAKARGMDLVTITDHDSIDGCLELLDRHPDLPDFIIGEEISCWLPTTGTPIEVHLGAYGMTERAHRDIQPLRKDAREVIAYLREARIFFALNHLFHFYRGQMPIAEYLGLLDRVPALETRNGAMLPAHNALIERILAARGAAGQPRHAIVAGSDAHTPRRIGRTWTEAPGRTREEFLANLAAGQGRAHGQQGATLALAADIYGVIADYWLSLIGLRRQQLSLPRRAFGMAFSLVSAPFEFIPLLVATISKSTESRRIERYADLLVHETAEAHRMPRDAEPMRIEAMPRASGSAAADDADGIGVDAQALALPRDQHELILADVGNWAQSLTPADGGRGDLQGPPFIPSPRLRGCGLGWGGPRRDDGSTCRRHRAWPHLRPRQLARDGVAAHDRGPLRRSPVDALQHGRLP
jgi:predicted metal-dependent phosphoesterase TrpH